MSAIRVLVVENEPLYREMLTIALQSASSIEVIGAVDGPDAAVQFSAAVRPDVILCDVCDGSDCTGIDMGLSVRHLHPRTGVVLLSDHLVAECMDRIPLEESAGWAYLLRGSTPDVATLIGAIEGAARGLVVLDPHVNQTLHPRKGTRLDVLTQRELEVLRLVAEGLSNAAIAARLFLAPKSLENHMTHLYHKLEIQHHDPEIHPRVQAVRLYLQATVPAFPRR